MNTLEEWTETVCAQLGIADVTGGRETVDLVLDLARDVAHGVARPAAPLTAYLVGLAVGRSADPSAAAPDLANRVRDLAAAWAGRPSGDSAPETTGGRG